MKPCYLLPLILFLLLFSLSSGRTLATAESDSDEYENRLNSDSEIADRSDSDRVESFEDQAVDRRSILSTSRASPTRQQIIDILRKAYNQGWKPTLKHYIPGTRFGRHR